MFWSSILAGLEVLRHWPFWLLVVASSAVSVLLVDDRPKHSECDDPDRSSSRNILGLLVRCLLTSVGVTCLIPTLLALSEPAPIQLFLSTRMIWVAAAPIIAFVTLVVASMIPLLGDVMSRSRPAQVFVEAWLPFLLVSRGLVSQKDAYPGVLATLGYFILAAVFGIISIGIVGAFVLSSGHRSKLRSGAFRAWSSALLCTLSGLVTLGMYASYVRLAVASAAHQAS